MYKLKRALATAGTGAVLALSMAGAASADAVNNCQAGYQIGADNKCVAIDNSETNNIDKSKTTTYTINGNCSAIIRTGDASADSYAKGGSGDDGGNGFLGTGGAGGSGGDAASSANASTSVTFSPDCSVTNTTVAAASTPAVQTAAAPQVVAPTGGVHAGAGGGLANASSTASIAGLVASAGSLGLGVALRKKSLLGLGA